MNSEVEFHIRHNYAWPKVPQNVRQVLLLARLDVCLLVYLVGLTLVFAPYVWWVSTSVLGHFGPRTEFMSM